MIELRSQAGDLSFSGRKRPDSRPTREGVLLRYALTCSAVLGGGTMFLSTCNLRTRDSIVNGAKIWFAETVLNPANLEEVAIGGATPDSSGG